MELIGTADQFNCYLTTSWSLLLDYKSSLLTVSSALALNWTTTTFNKLIGNVCMACYYHIRASKEIAKMLAFAIVDSRLDYCNACFLKVIQQIAETPLLVSSPTQTGVITRLFKPTTGY